MMLTRRFPPSLLSMFRRTIATATANTIRIDRSSAALRYPALHCSATTGSSCLVAGTSVAVAPSALSMGSALRHLVTHPIEYLATMIRPSRGAFVEEKESEEALSEQTRMQSATPAAESASSPVSTPAAPRSLPPAPAPAPAPAARPYCCLTHPSPAPRFLVVGLGNPGFPFNGTRHNIGRDLICTWQERWPQEAATGGTGNLSSGAGRDHEERRPLTKKIGSYKGPSRKGKAPLPDPDSGSAQPLPPHIAFVCASRVASVDAYRMFDLSQSSLHESADAGASSPPLPIPGSRQKAEAFSAASDPRTPGCTQPNCRCTIAIAAQEASTKGHAETSSTAPAPSATVDPAAPVYASSCRCRVLVSTPDLFMNQSGRAVSALSLQYRIPARRILVVYDDVSLPLGSLRISERGSAGGHNGMADIIKHVGGEAKAEGMIRIRIGIGPRANTNSEAQRAAAQREQEDAASGPAKKGKHRARTHAVPVLSAARGMNLASYVLQRFTAEDLELLSAVRQWAAQAVMHIVTPVPDRRAQAPTTITAVTAAASPSAKADAAGSVPVAVPSVPPPSCSCLHASDSSAALARRVQLAMTRFNGQRAKMAEEEE